MKSLSLTSILFVVFLILKLLGVISWSWWWVTAPLWLPFIIWVIAFVAILIISNM